MSETMTGPDGREYVSVVVAKSRPFAAACLAVWQDEDGQDRSRHLTFRSFWVPADLIHKARARLRAGRAA